MNFKQLSILNGIVASINVIRAIHVFSKGEWFGIFNVGAVAFLGFVWYKCYKIEQQRKALASYR